MAQRVALPAFAVVAVLGTSAVAAGSTYPRGALSFSGTCQFSGHVSFKPGLSNQAQTIRQRVRAPGSCSGTFVDRGGASHQVSDAKATYTATEIAPNSSCASGTDAGRGALVTPYGKLRFRISEARAGAGVVATATGARGGSAAGTAAPSSSGDPTVLADCAGAGIKRVPIDIAVGTTPEISG